MEALLAELPDEAREALLRQAEQLAQLSPAEQQAALAAAHQAQIDEQAEQIAAAARAAWQNKDLAALLPQLAEAAAHFAEGEKPDSPFDQLAQFTRAVIALLRGESPPPLPALYAEKFAALQRDIVA